MSSCQRFVYDCSLFDYLLLNNAPMQNTQVSETKEFKRSYSQLRKSKNGFKSFTESVMCYRGAIVAPKWKDVDPG